MGAEERAALVAEAKGESCHRCGRNYREVYLLPDDVWAKITPSKHAEGGLLCLSCADLLARQAGFVPFWSAGHLEYPEKRLAQAERTMCFLLDIVQRFHDERPVAEEAYELATNQARAALSSSVPPEED